VKIPGSTRPPRVHGELLKLGFQVAQSSVAKYMATLIGIGVLLNSPAEAVTGASQCEDQAANCVGRCVNPNGGTGQSKCMLYCDRQVTRCLIRVQARLGGGRR
jgi:hypothetical protein